jgi:hypothetical protein
VCLLLELGVACSAFLEWMRGQCECLEASCLGRHEATRGRSTMRYRWRDRAREGLRREYLPCSLILGSGATEMVPCILIFP